MIKTSKAGDERTVSLNEFFMLNYNYHMCGSCVAILVLETSSFVPVADL